MLTNVEERKFGFSLSLLTFVGGILRFAPAVLAAFPLNDGGMFLDMIGDLQSNNFQLPLTTSYNASHIPFVYPPFGFYLTGVLSHLFSVPALHLLRWLPPFVSVAIIPTFFWASTVLSGSKLKAIVATSLYALSPGISDWLIMGGGITRGLGVLFLVFSLGFVHDLFVNGKATTYAFAVMCCSLTILSHPEAGLQLVGLCLLLWIFFRRNLAGLWRAVALVISVLSVTSIWWLNILLRHGFSPLWSALHTGIRETLVASFFHTFFSTQGVLPLWPTLGLVGIFVALKNRDFFPALALVTPFLLDPRNAPAVAIFPLLLLVAEGLVFLYEQHIRSLLLAPRKAIRQKLPLIIFSLVLLYMTSVSVTAIGRLANLALTLDDRETMKWISQNTPPESSFLLITNTGQISPMTDAYQEWFPTLSNRKSVNTIQGLEWTLGTRFYGYSLELMALQSCPDITCLDHWLASQNAQVDYLLLLKRRASPRLIASLRDDPRIEVVYESVSTAIFRVPP